MAKSAAKPAAKKAAAPKKAMTKSAFVAHLAAKAEITKKQVETLLDEMIEVIKGQVSTKGLASSSSRICAASPLLAGTP